LSFHPLSRWHFWLPDIYQGSNLASLGFLSAPAKVATFGLLGFLLWGPFASLHEVWTPWLLGAAACSAVFGNFQAIVQTRLKCILAYSAVANAGFILLCLLLDRSWAFLFYLVAYGITTLGLIAAFMALGTATADVDEISDLQGLGKKHPWIAAGLTVLLFSLAGIPLTAGFAAKFAVVYESLKTGFEPAPGAIAVLTASVAMGLVSFFFYFKLVRALWLPNGFPQESDIRRYPTWNSRFVLVLSVAAVLALGLLMRLPGTPLP
jgi:NADH-quinone oxidoreductase subunit N